MPPASTVEVLTEHHPDCAALWPRKKCDCGYLEQHGPLVRDCGTCGDSFEQERRPGRPVKKCPQCQGE